MRTIFIDFKRIKSKIRNKRGVSILWVLILMVVIFTIGVSVLSAAFATQTVRRQYIDNKACMYYAKTVAQTLETAIEAPLIMNDTDPWYTIAQSVHDSKYGSTGTDAVMTLPDNAFTLDSDDADTLWIGEHGTVDLEITLLNQTVTVTTDYRPADTDAPDYGIGDELAEILEETNVSFVMSIKIKVKRNDQQYIIYETYHFTGNTKGEPGEGEGSGKIIFGQYELKSISTET